MIVSDVHRYVFVEMPNTASTAIAQELCEHYEGRPILYKHAQYWDFLRVANRDQRSFFAFAGSRHPMDIAISRYHKLRSDHRAEYSSDQHRAKRGGHVVANTARQFQAIQERNLEFSEWFRIVSRYPFDSRGSPDPGDFRAIIRFDHLQEDCSEVFRRLRIAQVRPIPLVNSTAGRETDYLSYFPLELRDRATACFGSFMRRWGYAFPDDWCTESVIWWEDFRFVLARAYRRLQHFRMSRQLLAQSGTT